MSSLKKKENNLFKSVKKKKSYMKIKYYTIKDRIKFINKIKNGEIKISNLDLNFPLINIQNPKNKLTYLQNKKMHPDDILTFFSNNDNYKCEYLNKCLGKVGIPFKLSIKNLNKKLFLKLSYIRKRNIDFFLREKNCINNDCLNLINIKEQYDVMNKYELNLLKNTNLPKEEKEKKKKRLLENSEKLDFLIKKKDLEKDNDNDTDNNNHNENEKNIILANYAENRLIFLFEELVLNFNTPHLILPIISYKTSFKNLNIDNLTIFNNSKKNMMDFNKYSIFEDVTLYLTEWCDNDTLSSFLNINREKFIKNPYLWNNLLFQLIYTLTVIQLKYPNFRHNDLHLGNILVSSYYTKGFNLYKIKLENKVYEYYIPNVGFQIKLWDFDWACLEPDIINIKALMAKKNMKNRTYDLFFILSKIEVNYKKIMENNYKTEHLLFFEDYRKDIKPEDIMIKDNHNKVLKTNKETEIAESILLYHSIKNKYSLFYNYLNKDKVDKITEIFQF